MSDHANFISYEYRGAVALNNIGVLLLQQRAYRQAMDTLKDSILLMKSVTRPNKDDPQRLPQNCKIEPKVKRANLRFAKPQSVLDHVGEGDDEIICIVHHDEYLSELSTFLQLQPGKQETRKFLPLRIEWSERCDNELHGSLDFEMRSATILYNFAIAHICVAKTAGAAGTNGEKLLRASLQLFQLARTILFSPSLQEAVEADAYKQTQVFLIGCLTMDATELVLRTLHRNEEAEEIGLRCRGLLRAIRMLQQETSHWSITEKSCAITA